MAATIDYVPPDDWPYMFGQAIPMVTPGSPPAIEFEVVGNTVRLKATKAIEPTHKLKVTSTGGLVGTGFVGSAQGGKELSPQGGKWAGRFFTIPVPAAVSVPDGVIKNVRLDWTSADTAIVENREKDHNADFDLAYDMTWKEVERKIGALAGQVFQAASTGNAQLKANYVDSMRPMWFDSKGQPTQDFIDNYAPNLNLNDSAQVQAAIKRWVAETEQDYDKENQGKALAEAKKTAINTLFQSLPAQLRPACAATDGWQILCTAATGHWTTAMETLVRKTEARDKGTCAEHSGDLLIDRYDKFADEIHLKRTTVARPAAPSAQIIKW